MKISIFLLLNLSLLSGCQAAVPIVESGSMMQSVSWFDGQRQRTVWLNEREFVEFGGGAEQPGSSPSVRQSLAGVRLIREGAGVRLWRVAEANSALRTVRSKLGQAHLSPVFHAHRQGGPRLALTGKIIVRFKPEWSRQQVQDWAAQHQLTLLKAILAPRNIYLFQSEVGLAALERANEIHASGEVVYATPDWWQEAFPR